MNSDELWDTSMERSKRTLLRVTISEDMNDLEQADLDAREADRIFRLLMGAPGAPQSITAAASSKTTPQTSRTSTCRLSLCGMHQGLRGFGA